MKHNKSARQRCIECRKWFHAAASARETQRVCCEGCRKRRDRELARARRERDLDGHREDERERQRKCRRARREKLGAGPVRVTGCHAPASALKPSELQEKLLATWDKQTALSRASLVLEIGVILLGSVPSGGTGAALSRATLIS